MLNRALLNMAPPSRKDRLLEVARAHVRDRGAAALSLREVAAEADVAVGLPFAHFRSREGLLEALREVVRAEVDAVVAKAIERRVPGPGFHERRLRAAVRAVVAWARREPNLYGLVSRYEVGPVERLVAILEEAEAAGELRFERSIGLVARLLWASLQGLIACAEDDDVLAELLDALLARGRPRT